MIFSSPTWLLWQYPHPHLLWYPTIFLLNHQHAPQVHRQHWQRNRDIIDSHSSVSFLSSYLLFKYFLCSPQHPQVHRQHGERNRDGLRNGFELCYLAGYHQRIGGEEQGWQQDIKVHWWWWWRRFWTQFASSDFSFPLHWTINMNIFPRFVLPIGATINMDGTALYEVTKIYMFVLNVKSSAFIVS